MKAWAALARALMKSDQRWRDAPMTAVANHMAAGNDDAALRAGKFLDRRDYGEACRRGGQMQHQPSGGVFKRLVAWSFAKLRAAAVWSGLLRAKNPSKAPSRTSGPANNERRRPGKAAVSATRPVTGQAP